MFGDKDPSKEFDDKFKNSKFSRLHTFNGIDDASPLWLRFNLCKRLRFPMQFGMDQEILLFDKNNSPKFFNWQSCSGMNPSILLSLRYNLCKLSNPPIQCCRPNYYPSIQCSSSFWRNQFPLEHVPLFGYNLHQWI